jgi:hypothetical protein
LLLLQQLLLLLLLPLQQLRSLQLRCSGSTLLCLCTARAASIKAAAALRKPSCAALLLVPSSGCLCNCCRCS